MHTLRKIGIRLLVLVLPGLAACHKQEVPEPDTSLRTGMPFASFHTDRKGESTVLGGDTVYLYCKDATDYREAVIQYEIPSEGAVVVCDGDTLESGTSRLDLTYPRTLVTYDAEHPYGIATCVQASCRAKIPILYITVGNVNQLNESQDEQPATVLLNPNGQVPNWPLQTHGGVIRARGNSTFGLMPKKSYKIKFNDRVGVLGFRSHRDWVLLANYADKTLMRTRLAFDMGRCMKLPYTPGDLFVEVFVNNQYAGVYQLTDQVEVDGGGRVEARYLLEINERHTDFRGSRSNYSFEIEHPTDFTADEKSEIVSFMAKAEYALLGGASNWQDPDKGFRRYWDVDTGIKWAIVNELFKNSDAKSYASIYMYQKVRDGKIHWGPLWDFDLGAGNYGFSNHGNCTQNETTGFFIFNNKYFQKMYTDAAYKARVKEIWTTYRSGILEIIESIPDRQAGMALPTQYNLQKWPTLKDYADYSNYNLPDTYEGQVKFMQEWLEKRWRWLDSQWGR